MTTILPVMTMDLGSHEIVLRGHDYSLPSHVYSPG